MGFTKREMMSDEELIRENERMTCDCHYNWDDKFWHYCPKHQAEREAEADNEAWHYLNEVQ